MTVIKNIMYLGAAVALAAWSAAPVQAQQELEIAADLESRLGRIEAENLNVRFSVTGDTVRIWGEVPSEATKERVEMLARETAGVGEVTSDLRVVESMGMGGAPVSDDELRARVIRALREAGVKDTGDLLVRTENGEVMLNGSRHSFRDVDRILSVVLNVEGVKGVQSNLQVNGRAYSALRFET